MEVSWGCHSQSYFYTFPSTHRTAEGHAHGNLGTVYELLNNMDKAIDHFEQVWVAPPLPAPLSSPSCDISLKQRNF